MKHYYQLRTWNLTKKNGWKSTFDDFDTLEELTKHVEYMEKTSPSASPNVSRELTK